MISRNVTYNADYWKKTMSRQNKQQNSLADSTTSQTPNSRNSVKSLKSTKPTRQFIAHSHYYVSHHKRIVEKLIVYRNSKMECLVPTAHFLQLFDFFTLFHLFFLPCLMKTSMQVIYALLSRLKHLIELICYEPLSSSSPVCVSCTSSYLSL